MLKMPSLRKYIGICLLALGVGATFVSQENPFEKLARREMLAPGNSLLVDLGYEVYEGTTNSTTRINSFKGQVLHSNAPRCLKLTEFRIRFAASPTGSLRWQAPQPPVLNRSSVLRADEYQAQCPQSPPATGSPITPTAAASMFSTEDCLFLNVFAPANASGLPVLVWIRKCSGRSPLLFPMIL
jgi:Carboxylesterase family